MLAERVAPSARTWRCVLVLLLTVAGIVAGLLAMHVVSTPVSHAHEFAAMEASASAPADAHSAESHPVRHGLTASDQGMSSGCSADGCDPMRAMTVMVCTLALLAGAILLIAPALRRAVLGVGPHAAPTNTARLIARAVGWAPAPSLVELSLDRR